MSGTENYIEKYLLGLVRDGKINRVEYYSLLSIFMREETLKNLAQIQDENELNKELLKIIAEASVHVAIPPHNVLQDDLSSPLDTFLLSTKKESDKKQHNSKFGLESLIKIDG